MFDIDAALKHVVKKEGSDLHVKVDAPPMARIHGELGPIKAGTAANGGKPKALTGQATPRRR